MLKMKKKKKNAERHFIDKGESQRELIYQVSIKDMVECLDEMYGKDRIVLTITLPYGLKVKVKELYPMLEDNKSAVLAYLINQGIARTLEKYHAIKS